MHKFFKRFISLISCFAFIIFSVVSIPASAIDYVDKSSFDDLRFKFDGSPESVYNYDYWVLCVEPYSYLETSKYHTILYLIADQSQESFGSTEGVLRFYTDKYPYNTKLHSLYTGNPGSPTDYEESVYYFSSFATTLSDQEFILSRCANFPTSYINGFVFDNYNLDKFPSYEGSSSNYYSKMIIASNVDMYNQYGELLQYGNYYTLLQFFSGTLDSTKIKDYSGHETAPGVVVEPTTGGGTGDSQTSKDQLETSKGILGTVKEIFNSIANLPGKIADAIGGNDEIGSHRAILGSGTVLLEGLDLSDVPCDGEYFLMAQPIRMDGREASFTRAVLIQDYVFWSGKAPTD